MDNVIKKITMFFGKNTSVIFFINIKGLWDSLKWIYEIIFKDNQNMESLPIGYNEIMLFITSVIIYAVFTNMRNRIVELTNKINQQSVIIDNIINYQTVVNKYNDIMIIRFEQNYKGNVCQVLDNDIKLFSKEELQDLNQYLSQKEKLRIEMKGRNETLGNVC